MNYQQTIDYLYSALPMFHRIGAAAYKANLDNIISLCNYLGNPQDKFTSIHIAGTNGKGSTSHMLGSIMMETSRKTGLFTSPHLIDFRERIKINGEMISKDWICEFVDTHKNYFEKIKPSFFEMSTAMAFQYFAEQKIDIAIIETGLGGRLDSTNIITPILSIITNIGYDHMNLLGNTLGEIGYEKAGIIKNKVPVVIGEYLNETKHVFIKKAELEKSDIYFTADLFTTNFIDYDPVKNYQTINLTDKILSKEIKFEIDLNGAYQIKNAASVYLACIVLNQCNFNINDDSISKGLKSVIKNTGLLGRWQKLNEEPLVICDTAHNEDGIKEIVQLLKNIEFKKLHLVLGMVNDKEIETILNLLPKNAIYYFCKADIPRGLEAGELKNKAFKYNLIGNNYESVYKAYNDAITNSEKEDLIFIGGSTFTVGELLAQLEKS